MSVATLTNRVKSSFEDYLESDSLNEVTEKLISLSQETKLDLSEIQSQFEEYLKEMGAEGEMLEDMIKAGESSFNDIIEPNKSVFWPDEYKNKKKLGGAKMKFKSGDSDSKSSSSDDDADPPASKSTSAKGEKPKVYKGYHLYSKEVRPQVEEDLKKDWESKYPEVPYTKNTSAVSKEIGARWGGTSTFGTKAQQKKNNVTPEKKQEFNDKADKLNKENGVEPRSKKTVDESKRKPLNGYQMYNKLHYSELEEEYRKAHKLKATDKVKSTEIFKMSSQRWNSEVKGTDKQKEYEDKAAKENERQGRKPVPKTKKASTSKTTAYREFGHWFREEHKSDSEDKKAYTVEQMMIDAWNNDYKEMPGEDEERKKRRQKFQDKADEVNRERGYPV